MHISIIGSGNVAWHIAKASIVAKHVIDCVTSKTIANAQLFAQTYNTQYVETIKKLPLNSDIYIIAVSDNAINDVLKDKIDNHSKFTVMYLDIDKFKAFTDYYGLYRANLIIKYLANLIVENVVKFGSPDDFIGHVGGDDFVIIFNDYESAKVVGDKIIEDFDLNVPSFYDEEDLENNYISVLNRQGVLQRFGIVTLSVTVLSNEFKDYNSTDEVYKQMMVIKREAKMVGGSILLQDIPE